MLFPDLGDALIPLTEDTPDDVGEWPANHAHGSIPGCRGHLANYRTREGGKKEKAQGFEPVRERVVCAMKCGGAPSQPADNHQPYTSADAHPRQPCYLGHTVPLAAFSCGGRVPDVCLPHYRDARMQHSQSRQLALPGVTTAVAPSGVPASTNEVFPASPTQSGNKGSRNKTRQSSFQETIL